MGTLDVLRNGLTLVPNLKFFLVTFMPMSGVLIGQNFRHAESQHTTTGRPPMNLC